ncbi:MAG: bifunctional phosphopantothenoylcysteine decarboxylase/phosphopantothenate--cysteine ligase CoaBC [Candidatus Hodarchaeales archaeon]|jgi:phosphopantothenoylcysteine decarboxylase/phosphopantothenate--cysteine ligase
MSIAEIYGTKGKLLEGKRILIGVTGSVAAIETPHLVREILRYSGKPIVVLSQEALRFVTADALTWSMGRTPYTEISGLSEHIMWSVDPKHKVDLYLLCPATANTISKLASGIADTPVPLTALACIGAKIPCLIVPAAHNVLLDNPITQKSIEYLKHLSVHFLSSEEEENKHKFPPLEKLMDQILTLLTSPRPLKGTKFLVTGGATREYFDEVRFLSNPSSGLSALYIVKELQNLGADVVFVLGEGNTIDQDLLTSTVSIVRSASDMYNTIKEHLSNGGVDGLISVAAVSDYQPIYQKGKIESLQDELTILLQPTIKIVKSVKNEFPSLFIVAYKAEVGISTKELVSRATQFLKENNVNIVCANWVGESDKGFVAKRNELFIVRDQNDVLELKGSKSDLGKELAKLISTEFNRRKEFQ